MALFIQAPKKEETPKIAPKRSSSIGVAFKRLFSKTPEPSDATRSTSEYTSSPLGPEIPQESSQRAGVRGRTPPKQRASPPSVGDQHPGGTSSKPSSTQSSPPNPIPIQQLGCESNILGGVITGTYS